MAAIIVITLFLSFFSSIFFGLKQNIIRSKNEVFGDPERTKGGWYWALCGLSAILLIWFYFSWGLGRAFFPNFANEMCQIAKVEEALSPVTATLPIQSRYYKSTTLVVRNLSQLSILEKNIPHKYFDQSEIELISQTFLQIKELVSVFSNPKDQSLGTTASLKSIENEITKLANSLTSEYKGFEPSELALLQPKWGVTEIEIPMIPTTPKGILFEKVALDAQEVTNIFLKLRNQSSKSEQLIKKIRDDIKTLRQLNEVTSLTKESALIRKKYIKALERIFKRLDDGNIFSANALAGINSSVKLLNRSIVQLKGNLNSIDFLFFPGAKIIKSRTQCTEQGSARWLPKPTDVAATFANLANPNIEKGGGYKGTTLLWWKWLSISELIAVAIPDHFIDLFPGEYSQHDSQGKFNPKLKDLMLQFAQGDIYLGSIPMLDGHIWDSMFRVLVALTLGVFLGVPLGIYMGVSRFFKSFFDPLIELYRPVPPLAWAPLILTIFGIQDDGKIFLLFMVAFAIMVISARTGASGTQLSKIRASHSLGASNQQILRYVILPNALPEILTGIRISIGVCWGTLVAAEMLAGTTGVGFIENVARTVSDYELIWVTILIMGLLGLLFDLVMRWLIAKLIPWRGKG